MLLTRRYSTQGYFWTLFVYIMSCFSLCIASAAELSAGHYTDIVYGRAGEKKLLLDVFVPTGEHSHPAVILIHGGGWGSGDKQDMDFLGNPLAEAGFTCFSISYRLAPEYRWPACIDDVNTAIRWIKDNASRYKADPERVALIGYSAGGHLACFAATRADDSTRVQAVVGLAPPTDLVADIQRRGGMSVSLQHLFDRPEKTDDQSWTLLRVNSPIQYVTSDCPPFLLVHGTRDQSVPYSQSVNFRAKLRENGVRCDLVTLTNAEHRISEWHQYDPAYIQKIVEWLTQTLMKDVRPDRFTVNTDGTGDFETVQAAVNAVPDNSTKPTMIMIEPGIYKEKIVIPRSKRFLTFRGKNAQTTVLTYHLSARMKDENGQELGTFRTPSVTIEADDFTAENVTFENSAGDVGQAIAVTVVGDRSIFRNCRFLGWQDTLLDQTGRHYYEKCTISGHCDFIFGGGTAFFESCQIYCLDASYITAASTPKDQRYGYVFSNCSITGYPEKPKTYLGRPWRDDAYVAFLNTKMTTIIRPEGWHNWSKPHREQTSRYYEYNSTGPGADTQKRVDWAHELTDEQAQQITVQSVLSGEDGWDPTTNTVRSMLEMQPARKSDIERLRQCASDETEDGAGYLFTATRTDDADGLYLACSKDGLDWTTPAGPVMRGGAMSPIINPDLIRDPHGMFHLVWQMHNSRIGYARSLNLTNWTDIKSVKVMQQQNACDVVEPNISFDAKQKQFLIFWSSTLPGNYYQAYQEPVDHNPRLWYTTTADFEQFTAAAPLFDPGYSVKSGRLVKQNDHYILMHEDNRRAFKTLRFSDSRTPTGPWSPLTDALPLICRSPAVLDLGNDKIVYFDRNSERGALVTHDFNTWKDISAYVRFPVGFHYGNVIKVGPTVLKAIREIQS